MQYVNNTANRSMASWETNCWIGKCLPL